jgi:hypothetical protein
MPVQVGLTKEQIIRKFDEGVEPSIPSKEPFQSFSKLVSKLVGVLIDLGLPFPLWLVVSDPRKTVFTRQNVAQLNPGQSIDLSFQARNKGFLVLNTIEVAPQDALAYEALRIEFIERNRENNVDFSTDKGNEAGFWKFSKRILFDESTFTVRLTNTDLFGLIAVSFFFEGWEI